MILYHKLGEIPKVKHTAFYKPDGKSLYREELISTKGFSGVYSNVYRMHSPTQTIRINELTKDEDVTWAEAPLMHFHFNTDKLKKDGDFLSSRIPYLYNSHCKISTAKPTKNAYDYFYKNALHDEYIFVHHGSGKLKTHFGVLPFEDGDEIIIPRGTIYQMDFDNFVNNKLLICESDSPYEIPKHYRNEYGQFEEHAPYCERDFKLPEYMAPIDQKGEFKLLIKAGDRNFEYIIPTHPFDVIGWDGYLFPFGFNIKSYHPKVGRIHLPPPIHLLYQTQHFVLCNFNPRPFDWYPGAIPAPYFHSNVDSAEVLYYAEGDFMSRKGVSEGSVTLHPLGIPHGPQPGKTEASIGVDKTDEYAVMIDTFEPLHPTIHVKNSMDEGYYKSWLE